MERNQSSQLLNGIQQRSDVTVAEEDFGFAVIAA